MCAKTISGGGYNFKEGEIVYQVSMLPSRNCKRVNLATIEFRTVLLEEAWQVDRSLPKN